MRERLAILLSTALLGSFCLLAPDVASASDSTRPDGIREYVPRGATILQQPSAVAPSSMSASASPAPAAGLANRVVYTSGRTSAVLIQREDQAAVVFKPEATHRATGTRIMAEAERVGWEIVRPIPDFAMAIVKTAPDKARHAAATAGVPIRSVYPVFHLLNDPDLPIIATEEIFVAFNEDVAEPSRHAFLQENGLQFAYEGPGGAWKVIAPVSGLDAILLTESVKDDPRIDFIQPNFIFGVRLHLAPRMTNDPYVRNQWHLNNSKFNTINHLGTVNSDSDVFRFWTSPAANFRRGEGIVVAVIDSGVDLGHEDLRDNLVNGWDFVDNDAFPNPDCEYLMSGCAHGTEVAGIIAAVADNGIGVAGIAPKAKIMPIRIFYDPLFDFDWGVVSEERIANAVRFAVDKGADVINNSWGGGPNSDLIERAFIHGAQNGRGGKGTINLASAGNEFTHLSYPAAFPSVMSVGAISDQDHRISYSSAGPNLDIVASSQDLGFNASVDIFNGPSPDGIFQNRFRIPTLVNNTTRTGIWTTDVMGIYGSNPGYIPGLPPMGDPDGHYYNAFNGTSASCPVAAGCAALLLSARPDWSFEMLRERVNKYADPAGNPLQYFDPDPEAAYDDAEGNLCIPHGFTPNLGHGRINPLRALLGIPKPYPYRNQIVGYKVDWTDPDDFEFLKLQYLHPMEEDDWTTPTLGWYSEVTRHPFPLNGYQRPTHWLYLGDGFEAILNQWTQVARLNNNDEVEFLGWREIFLPGFRPTPLPTAPQNLAHRYRHQIYLRNLWSNPVPNTDHGLYSPTFFIPSGSPRYASLVVEHRWSLPVLGGLLLPGNHGQAFEIDSGFVEVSFAENPSFSDDNSWRLLETVRGTSAGRPDYSREGQTLVVKQTIPIGEIWGRDFLTLRFRFLSNYMNSRFAYEVAETETLAFFQNPPIPYFGWNIQSVKIVLYDLNEQDYLISESGAMPDWSSDSKTIYYTNPEGNAINFKDADQGHRWGDGVPCDNFPRGTYLASPEGDKPITGLDFHPVTDQIAISYDNTQADSRYIAAIQALNGDGFDGQVFSEGVQADAKHVRYSSDGHQVVFTDGTYIYTMAADTVAHPPVKYSPVYIPPPPPPPSPCSPPVVAPPSVQLVNIGHPVFAFSDQRIVFEAGTIENPETTNLYILNRDSRFVERKLVDWPRTNEKMAEINRHSDRLLFVSNTMDWGDSPGTTQTLYLLNNFRNVVQHGAAPQIFQFNPDWPSREEHPAPRHIGWPRFSPDNERIVYTFDDTVRVRKIDYFPPVEPPLDLLPADRMREGSLTVSDVALTYQSGKANLALHYAIDSNNLIVSPDSLADLRSQPDLAPHLDPALGTHEFLISPPPSDTEFVTLVYYSSTEMPLDVRSDGESVIVNVPVACHRGGDWPESQWAPAVSNQTVLTFHWYDGDPMDGAIIFRAEALTVTVTNLSKSAADPTPVPTPVLPAIAFQGEIDFGSGSPGWTDAGAIAGFESPGFQVEPGVGHILRSTNSHNTFGFLTSPVNSVSVIADKQPGLPPIHTLTLVRWWVSGRLGSHATSKTSLPDFRLRATSADFQDSQMIHVVTRGNASQLPSLDPAYPSTYDLLLVPAPGVEDRPTRQQQFSLAFDMLNFEPTNAPDGELILHRLEFYRVPAGIEQRQEPPQARFDFHDDDRSTTQGWVFIDVPAFFNTPRHYAFLGGLHLYAPNDSTNSFGYWYRDDIPVATIPGIEPGMPFPKDALLRFDWEVKSFTADPKRVPSFRVRAGAYQQQINNIRHVSSTGPADLGPRSFTRTYTTYLRPVEGSLVPATVDLAFDMLNFDPGDDPNGHLMLDNLKVYMVRMPSYPVVLDW